jgi:two-component system phosphate regulon response regulator PhoB
MTVPEGPRVLLIEDDRDVADLLTAHLRRLGCQVSRAATGEAGLDAAAGSCPDVVLIDVLLPGMDGVAVAAELRRDPRTAGCRLVMTSVLDEAELRDMGADGVLTKPFSRRDVAQMLTALDRPSADV